MLLFHVRLQWELGGRRIACCVSAGARSEQGDTFLNEDGAEDHWKCWLTGAYVPQTGIGGKWLLAQV